MARCNHYCWNCQRRVTLYWSHFEIVVAAVFGDNKIKLKNLNDAISTLINKIYLFDGSVKVPEHCNDNSN